MAPQIVNIISKKATSHLSYRSKRFYLILLFVFIGFLLSGFQVFGQSRDYVNYDIFFNLLRHEDLSVIYEYRFEPGFSILAFLMTILFASDAFAYGGIVASILLLKGWSISVYSTSKVVFLVAATFYFARYYPLHELTQLRVAGAVGFLMIATIFLWRGNLLYGLLACAVALLFHMSAVAVIPALFIYPTNRWKTMLVGLGAFITVFVFTDLIITVLSNHLAVFENYQKHGFGDNVPNPFSSALLLDWAMIGIALAMWSSLSLLMRRIILLQIIGMMIFYGGMDFPVVAHRIRELYSVFWVFFSTRRLSPPDSDRADARRRWPIENSPSSSSSRS